jgi:hypothetical protein
MADAAAADPRTEDSMVTVLGPGFEGTASGTSIVKFHVWSCKS